MASTNVKKCKHSMLYTTAGNFFPYGWIYTHDVQTERQVLLFVYLFICSSNYATFCMAIPWYIIDKVIQFCGNGWINDEVQAKKEQVWMQLPTVCSDGYKKSTDRESMVKHSPKILASKEKVTSKLKVIFLS